MLLTNVNNKLQVVSASTADLDVHASWMDLSASAISTGRLNTKITGAATVNVVDSPGSSTSRRLKDLHIANVHASAPNKSRCSARTGR